MQEKAIRTISGLENVKILRLGYAVEYDFFPPHQLKHTLETKAIKNLFFAGQINGTSGYEEAAAQGIIAGINAALNLRGEAPLILDRSQAYIGVLIDDLINKIHTEPYRMFTSSAEFRLLLRHDNADLRLMETGRNLGLIDDRTYGKFAKKKEDIQRLEALIKKSVIKATDFNERFKDVSTPLQNNAKAEILLKRPEIKLKQLLSLISENQFHSGAVQEVEYNIKYDGYLNRQRKMIEKFKELENKKLPDSLDYQDIKALSAESREKLMKIRPENLGQAARISGVKPADISVLLIYLTKKIIFDVSRGTKIEFLQIITAELKIPIIADQIEKLLQYADLIKDWNKRVHLISKNDIDFVLERHIVPSLFFVKILKNDESIGKKGILDLGTGAGLPGCVVSILKPDWSVILLDSSRKKTLFLKQVKKH